MSLADYKKCFLPCGLYKSLRHPDLPVGQCRADTQRVSGGRMLTELHTVNSQGNTNSRVFPARRCRLGVYTFAVVVVCARRLWASSQCPVPRATVRFHSTRHSQIQKFVTHLASAVTCKLGHSTRVNDFEGVDMHGWMVLFRALLQPTLRVFFAGSQAHISEQQCCMETHSIWISSAH